MLLKRIYCNVSILLFVLFSLIASACESSLDSEIHQSSPYESTSGTYSYNIPSPYGADLSSLGKAAGSMQIQYTRKCDPKAESPHQKILSEFCEVQKLQEIFIIDQQGGDSDGDGIISCDDFLGGGQETGLLMMALCNSYSQNQKEIDNIYIQSNDKYYAISLTDFDLDDSIPASGFWTAGSPDVFPMNLRIWGGSSSDSLKPILKGEFENNSVGSFVFDLNPQGHSAKGIYRSEVYKDGCVLPDTDQCYEIRTHLSGTNLLPKNRLHKIDGRLVMDDLRNPSIIAFEIFVEYQGNSEERNRKIYLHGAQLGDYLWVKGHSEGVVGELSDYDKILAKGLCQDLTVPYVSQDCSNFPVQEANFKNLFLGLESLLSERPNPEVHLQPFLGNSSTHPLRFQEAF